MIDKLKRYAELRTQAEAIRSELASIEADLQTAVAETGSQLAGYGYCAYMKPGRKSIDHEAAAKWANVPGEIVKKYTKVKETIAWAQVTKAANVDVTNFTVIGEPVFFIEEFLEA